MTNAAGSPQERNLIRYIIFLFIAHIISGAFQTPSQVLESGLNQGLSKLSICIGYSFGIFTMFGLILSVLFLAFIFILKYKNAVFLFQKELCKILLFTLALNLLVGFIIVPMIL